MGKMRLGKHHVTYEGDGVSEAYRRLARLAMGLAMRSRSLRSFLFGLPPSRLRMLLGNTFFVGVTDVLTDPTSRAAGRIYRLGIQPDAEMSFFGMATYRGPDAWRATMGDWIETFRGSTFVLEESVSPPGSNVVYGVLRVQGQAASGNLSLGDRVYAVLQVERGMMASAGFYTDRPKALKAAGLSE